MNLEADAEQALRQGIAALPFTVTDEQITQFRHYLILLNRWNAVHNLTAVRRQREQVITHILDCLAILPYLPQTGYLADIGSGAGLPALIIAIMRPEIVVAAVESNHKKAAFIRQAAIAMALNNVEVVTERAEHWQPERLPTVIISRAMAAPNLLLELTAHLGDAHSQWILMCGHEPEFRLREGFVLCEAVSIKVPLQEAARTLLVMVKEK